ncbi:MAG TPA: flagellar export chaperone FliS [Bryobacteraceae bacterium]|nr:flagellar export chaperone FliS [Bryobacteraceae bacterium]
MSSNVNERYLEARVMSASPVELVRILYGAAQQSVREARRHLALGNTAERSREISRAVEILVELSGAVDREKGGELSGRLVELYDYMVRRLTEAHLRQEDTPLEEVLRLLATLSEAWSELADPGTTSSQPATAPLPDPPAIPVARVGYGVAAFMAAPQQALAGQSWSA